MRIMQNYYCLPRSCWLLQIVGKCASNHTLAKIPLGSVDFCVSMGERYQQNHSLLQPFEKM